VTEAIAALIGLTLLITVGIAVAWQARRRSADLAIVYSVEDSIEFVYAGLSDGAVPALQRSDLRRILEWSVRYLQEGVARSDAHSVAGGLEAATYVQERGMSTGFAYDAEEILEVLQLQAEYLASLGAVGAEVRNHIVSEAQIQRVPPAR
jgi:hypothetical protein